MTKEEEIKVYVEKLGLSREDAEQLWKDERWDAKQNRFLVVKNLMPPEKNPQERGKLILKKNVSSLIVKSLLKGWVVLLQK